MHWLTFGSQFDFAQESVVVYFRYCMLCNKLNRKVLVILFKQLCVIQSIASGISFIFSFIQSCVYPFWFFRARKRNPLRGRQDTYECTVEQLVVGSLMFTPLLLLLPTTSVFYTFFTLIYSILSIVRLCLQYLILILQLFPYAEVALWLLQPKRFPSGVWFKALDASQNRYLVPSPLSITKYLRTLFDSQDKGSRESWHSMQRNQFSISAEMKVHEYWQDGATTLVSALGIETASLGTFLSICLLIFYLNLAVSVCWLKWLGKLQTMSTLATWLGIVLSMWRNVSLEKL